MGRLFFLIYLFVTVPASLLSAKEIYVDNVAGHDRNSGQSALTLEGISGPVKTIQHAIALAEAGDTIVLKANPAPYKEAICLQGKNNSGFEVSVLNVDKSGHIVPDMKKELPVSNTSFTIEGNGAILDGVAYLPIEVWRYVGGNTFRFRPANFTFFQLYQDGKPLKRVSTPENATILPAVLHAGEWCIYNGFAYVCFENFKRPQDYEFTYTDKMTGITLLQVKNVHINDLVVQGFQVDGIAIVNNSKDVVFDNVVIRGNGRYGLSIGNAATVAVGYSLFGDNAAAQISVGNNANLALYFSTIKSNDLIQHMPPHLRNGRIAGIANHNGNISITPSEKEIKSGQFAQSPPNADTLWDALMPLSAMKDAKSEEKTTQNATSISTPRQPLVVPDNSTTPQKSESVMPKPINNNGNENPFDVFNNNDEQNTVPNIPAFDHNESDNPF